jgi:hypothetical protein
MMWIIFLHVVANGAETELGSHDTRCALQASFRRSKVTHRAFSRSTNARFGSGIGALGQNSQSQSIARRFAAHVAPSQLVIDEIAEHPWIIAPHLGDGPDAVLYDVTLNIRWLYAMSVP